MLAVATKLEQGVTNGTFTRQDELAIFAVVLATVSVGWRNSRCCLLAGVELTSEGVGMRVWSCSEWASRVVFGVDVVVVC